ncbi:MAG TPA: ABC transporter substrate-binding protein, partial [Solirubrobacterales bacterium]|nr:ABC transporter substrate-binding protein [Solirubrobacterales bacterium]
MKIFGGIAVALALLLLGGCGEEDGGRTTEAKTTAAPVEKPEPKPQNLRPLEITVDGYPNPDYAGLFLAQQRGYFEDAGLDLSIHTPILPSKALPYVAEGTVDLAVSHEPEVVLARERGVPVIAVGALLGRPTTALIWLKKSPIRAVADLAGKTVATEGLPYQESFLQAILAEEGLGLEDVKVVTVGYDLTSALESGRVDAIIGGSWNVEGLQVQADGPEPVVVPVADQGIDGYDELVLIARQDRLHRIGDKVRDFISALARGTR